MCIRDRDEIRRQYSTADAEKFDVVSDYICGAEILGDEAERR